MSGVVINVNTINEKIEDHYPIEKEVNDALNERVSSDTHVSILTIHSEVQANPTFFSRVRKLLHSRKFHYFVIGLVLLDLIIVLVELILSLNIAEEVIPETHNVEDVEFALFIIGASILGFFVLEILLKFTFIGPRHFLNVWQFVDVIVVFSSFIMEIYFHVQEHAEEEADRAHALLDLELHNHVSEEDKGNHSHVSRVTATALVIIRLWKFVRIIHAVAHAVEIKNHIVIEHVEKAKGIAEDRIRKHKNRAKTLERLVKEQQNIIKKLQGIVNTRNVNITTDPSEKEKLINDIAKVETTRQELEEEPQTPTYEQSAHSIQITQDLPHSPSIGITIPPPNILPASPPYSPRSPSRNFANPISRIQLTTPRQTQHLSPLSNRLSHISNFSEENTGLDPADPESATSPSVYSFHTAHSRSKSP